jgi:hypothetical protein
MLIRVSYKSNKGIVEWKSLGEQITLKNLNSENFMDKIVNLQKVILDRLDISMDNYGFNNFNIVGIQIIVYHSGFDVKPIKKDLKLKRDSFGDNRDLVNVSELTNSVNYENIYILIAMYVYIHVVVICRKKIFY